MTNLSGWQAVVAVVGLPGVGKSTLVAALATRCGGSVFAVGDRLRAQAALGDADSARLLREALPMPISTFRTVLRDYLASAEAVTPVFLDGSPRTTEQAVAISVLIDVPLYGLLLDLDERTAATRLHTRSQVSKRVDDTGDVARVGAQAASVAEVSRYVMQHWPSVRIDATASPSDILYEAIGWLESQAVPG